MRKIFGGLLGFIAMIFLSLAYAQMAHAEDPVVPKDSTATQVPADTAATTTKADPVTKATAPEEASSAPVCGVALAEKLSALTDGTDEQKKAKQKIIDLQLNITLLKLASATMNSNSKTVEAYVKKQQDVLNSIDVVDSEGRTTRQNLTGLYKRFGVEEDSKTIIERAEKGLTKLSNGKYASVDTRFQNADLSAFVYASVLKNGDQKPFSIEDAAILWYQAQISEGVTKKMGGGDIEKGRGKAPSNYQEMSTRIFVLTGMAAGMAGKTVGEMETEMKGYQAELDTQLDFVVTSYRDDLKKSCKLLESCADCKLPKDGEEKRSALAKAFELIKDDMQSKESVHDETVDKVIARMTAKGITIDLQPVGKLKLPSRTSKEVTARAEPVLKNLQKDGAVISAEKAKESVSGLPSGDIASGAKEEASDVSLSADSTQFKKSDTTQFKKADTVQLKKADTTQSKKADTAQIKKTDSAQVKLQKDTTKTLGQKDTSAVVDNRNIDIDDLPGYTKTNPLLKKMPDTAQKKSVGSLLEKIQNQFNQSTKEDGTSAVTAGMTAEQKSEFLKQRKIAAQKEEAAKTQKEVAKQKEIKKTQEKAEKGTQPLFLGLQPQFGVQNQWNAKASDAGKKEDAQGNSVIMPMANTAVPKAWQTTRNLSATVTRQPTKFELYLNVDDAPIANQAQKERTGEEFVKDPNAACSGEEVRKLADDSVKEGMIPLAIVGFGQCDVKVSITKTVEEGLKTKLIINYKETKDPVTLRNRIPFPKNPFIVRRSIDPKDYDDMSATAIMKRRVEAKDGELYMYCNTEEKPAKK